MAKPIKETPVLKGRDADRFMEQMKRSSDQKISPSERQQIKNSYERIKSISNF